MFEGITSQELQQIRTQRAALARDLSTSIGNAATLSVLDLNISRQMFPTRQSLADFVSAHCKTRWPDFYGESPYGALDFVLSNVLHSRGGYGKMNGARRALQMDLVHRVGTPAQRELYGMTDARRPERVRFRRLVTLIAEVGVLSEGEAESAVRHLLRTHQWDRKHLNHGPNEAVVAAGGSYRLLRRALSRRHELAHA